MVEMPGDLLGATARGEMLGAVQRRAALFGREARAGPARTSGTARRAHVSHGASAEESTTI